MKFNKLAFVLAIVLLMASCRESKNRNDYFLNVGITPPPKKIGRGL